MMTAASPPGKLPAPPSEKPPTRSKRFAGQESDRRILAAARGLFLQAGYAGVNLDTIAEQAGVSRQTLYNRFKSKEAIFTKVIERHWESLDMADFLFEDGTQASPSAEVYLRNVARTIALFVSRFDQIPFTRLVIAESRHMPWIAEEFYRFGKKPLVEGITRGLVQLRDGGLLDCPNPTIATHQFLGLIQEFLIWPGVMAVGDGLAELPEPEIVIDEAIATFLARYGARS